MPTVTSIHLIEKEKPVPYPQDFREDSIGYGFRNLKGRPELVSGVPEVKTMQGMQKALRALCKEASPFFSIGCEKAVRPFGANSYIASGYIEFAFNFRQVAGYPNYENLHMAFENSAWFRKVPSSTKVEWAVAPVLLIDLHCRIHSCAVWISSSNCPTVGKSLKALDKSFAVLGDFLDEIAIDSRDFSPIYETEL